MYGFRSEKFKETCDAIIYKFYNETLICLVI